MKLLVVLVSLLGVLHAWSAIVPLEEQVQNLEVKNAPVSTTLEDEKLYAIQSRPYTLTNRLEVSIGGSKNFNQNNLYSTYDLNADIHFYFSNRFYIALNGSYAFNSLSTAGDHLWEDGHLLADAAFVKYRTDLTLGYHLFYGKFRMSMDKVFYFDQYIALGVGTLQLTTGISQNWATAAVGTLGIAFWLGDSWSVRLGVKDYFFNENRRLGSGFVHDILGGVELGYVLGSSA